jgi:hypothetical protein
MDDDCLVENARGSGKSQWKEENPCFVFRFALVVEAKS